MSDAWVFHSYSSDALAEFERRSYQSKLRVMNSLVREEFDPEEDEEIFAAVKKAAKSGISYEAFDEEEKFALDEALPLIFHEEALGKHIDWRPISEEFLKDGTVSELLALAERNRLALTVVPLFKEGRRYGEISPSDCRQAFLSPAELVSLKAEVDSLIHAATVEGNTGLAEAAQRCLLQPCQTALKSGAAIGAFFL